LGTTLTFQIIFNLIRTHIVFTIINYII